jgi:hypothetical protein
VTEDFFDDILITFYYKEKRPMAVVLYQTSVKGNLSIQQFAHGTV